MVNQIEAMNLSDTRRIQSNLLSRWQKQWFWPPFLKLSWDNFDEEEGYFKGNRNLNKNMAVYEPDNMSGKPMKLLQFLLAP